MSGILQNEINGKYLTESKDLQSNSSMWFYPTGVVVHTLNHSMNK